jgi:CheY-like chemotaxis protein
MTTELEIYDGWDDEPTGRFALLPRARVLVAEDDPELRAMIVKRLRADGCDVIEAENGQDALDKLDELSDGGVRRDELDLLVMDVRMPGLTGLDITYLLRSWRWVTPVVLVTAYPEPELCDEAFRLEAKILAKPFGFARLSEAALAAVKGRGI